MRETFTRGGKLPPGQVYDKRRNDLKYWTFVPVAVSEGRT
jgi:hypothetical protein